MNNDITSLIGSESLNRRVSGRLDIELQRQKDAGKKFLSDDEIDSLIDRVIKEELENPTKTRLITTSVDRIIKIVGDCFDSEIFTSTGDFFGSPSSHLGGKEDFVKELKSKLESI